MAGRILISDAVVTNRIVLRCKLAAAYYDVVQAGSSAEITTFAANGSLDAMILDADNGWQTPLQAACGTGATPPCPVILLSANATAADRADAIRAGAAAVLHRPLDEDLLLATLRRVMRERGTDAELIGQAGLSCSVGMNEAAAEFRAAETVNLIALDQTRINALSRPLEQAFGGVVRCSAFADTLLRQPADLAGRAFVLLTQAEKGGQALRLISELRSRSATRDAAILLAIVPVTAEGRVSESDPAAAELAATALDIGADDVQFDDDPAELAARIDRQLQLKRRRDALRNTISAGLRLAARDPLTGLYNRRVALPRLADLLATACETGRAVTVMVADLDRFKAINDTFGHASGDRVLVEVARRIRKSVSSADLIARIGGEEFLIALPDTTLDSGSVVADRIRHALRGLPVRDPGVPEGITVTASIGLACYMPEILCTVPPRPEDVLQIADQALLRAKSDGRDKITVARSAA